MNNTVKCILYVSSITLGTLFSCTNNSVDNDVQVFVESSDAIYLNSSITTTMVSCTVITTTNTTTTITTTNTTTTTTPENPVEEIKVTEFSSIEPTILSDDTLCIRDKIIYLTYADALQENVDRYDVVYPTGYLADEGTDRERIEIPENLYPYTMLFGHNYKSFSILPYIEVGELFYINVHGTQTVYEVQRSESAYDNEDSTRVYFYSDNLDILYADYGYNALILITCYENHRWIIVAKPVG